MIPSNIASELTSIQAQLVAASPLTSAPFATIKALQLNAANLVADVQSALVGANMLDNWQPSSDPTVIISAFQSLVVLSTDQSTLSLMRGVVGRASSNLDQLV